MKIAMKNVNLLPASYNIAAIFAQTGQPDKALAYLRRHFYSYERFHAVREKEMMEARVDAVFDSLRDDRAFLDLTKFADGKLPMRMSPRQVTDGKMNMQHSQDDLLRLLLSSYALERLRAPRGALSVLAPPTARVFQSTRVVSIREGFIRLLCGSPILAYRAVSIRGVGFDRRERHVIPELLFMILGADALYYRAFRKDRTIGVLDDLRLLHAVFRDARIPQRGAQFKPK